MSKIEFSKGQQVYCPLFGAGIISDIITGKKEAYPVKVNFANMEKRSYTLNGTFFCGVNPTLRPIDKIVSESTKGHIEKADALITSSLSALKSMVLLSEIPNEHYNKICGYLIASKAELSNFLK